MKLEEYANLSEKKSFFDMTTIDTYKGFDDVYQTLKRDNVIFRGVNEAKYKLYTSAQREWIINEYEKQGINYTSFIQSQLNYIRGFSIISHYYKSLNVNENDMLYISLLQHYGAPSPLLDFTYDLDIALYFALDKIKTDSSNIDIDNYFSLYFIDKNQCGNELVDIVSMLRFALESGKDLLDDYIRDNPHISIDDSLLCSVDQYTKWLKDDDTKDGLHKLDCGFIDNPLRSGTLSMYKTSEVLYWSNINLIAQNGCFIFYTNDKEPLELFFTLKNTLPKVRCINIHKSLVEYIKNKYIAHLSEQDIYPKLDKMCKDSYHCFKRCLK